MRFKSKPHNPISRDMMFQDYDEGMVNDVALDRVVLSKSPRFEYLISGMQQAGGATRPRSSV